MPWVLEEQSTCYYIRHKDMDSVQKEKEVSTWNKWFRIYFMTYMNTNF